ncbi:MAG: CRISPR-associated protein Csx15 [Anaerolineae bacterium]|nr:CRISPR-associated protein Csx15 [Thermoflexus sp.]MDW8064307.1 CRISPR-associated protein Csx15 [Anaerolineae bacterium]
MILVNFAHPMTDEQLRQVEALIGQPVGQVIHIDAQIDPQEPLAPQVIRMVDRVGLTAEEWQTRPLLVALPSLNYSAGVLLAELHGRMGYFPSIVRLRPVVGATPPCFEVAEIINLQAVRDAARARRSTAQS